MSDDKKCVACERELAEARAEAGRLADIERLAGGIAERAESAEADNAALVGALRNLSEDSQHAEHVDCPDGPCPVREAREALAATHPGAALLKEVEALRALADEVEHDWPTGPHPRSNIGKRLAAVREAQKGETDGG